MDPKSQPTTAEVHKLVRDWVVNDLDTRMPIFMIRMQELVDDATVSMCLGVDAMKGLDAFLQADHNNSASTSATGPSITQETPQVEPKTVGLATCAHKTLEPSGKNKRPNDDTAVVDQPISKRLKPVIKASGTVVDDVDDNGSQGNMAKISSRGVEPSTESPETIEKHGAHVEEQGVLLYLRQSFTHIYKRLDKLEEMMGKQFQNLEAKVERFRVARRTPRETEQELQRANERILELKNAMEARPDSDAHAKAFHF
ncbi:hypothetical protein HD806DRAFT_527883 [Xylariaceae sp. AK1471]|nr:hypothetical protein HD806DRAFT_527883 [Xylariaceae sp. AK1471]